MLRYHGCEFVYRFRYYRGLWMDREHDFENSECQDLMGKILQMRFRQKYQDFVLPVLEVYF